ncbi:MAG: BamA/TamA family outer membrane protein [Melioribacteraceae bacterium]|nr:BamA/TamA family outer membrane protein [Melioribacteraceae bacterium]
MKQTIKIAVLLLILISVNSSAQQDTVTLSPKFTTKILPFGLTTKVPASLPKVSLALSGGGSRALIALGVLKALEEHNIPIEYIVGTSMGSILGGLYASGYSIDELDSIITSIDWNHFYTAKETQRNELYLDQKITDDVALFSIDIDGFNPVLPTSFNSGQRFQNFLNYYTINAPIHPYGSFDQLRYKFRAVSTDLTTGKMVILDKGSLSQALRASSSVTFLLEPVEIDSMLLVDGGLVANVPVNAAAELDSDYIIAVDASSQLRKRNDLDTPLKIADQIVSIPMNMVTEQNLKLANVIIAPELKDRKNDDFSSLDSIIQVGYKSTIDKIETITRDILEYQFNNICDTVKYYSNIVPYSSKSKIESKIVTVLNEKNIVSNREILLALSKEYEKGDYSYISADLFIDEDITRLKVNYLLKPIIKKIELIGSNENNTYKILDILSPLVNNFYSEKNLVEYLISTLSYYRNIGYPFAEIENIEFTKETNRLTISIDEGIVNSIIVSGNERSRTPLIMRELEIKEGEYLTSDKLSKSLENLRTTGLFTSVDINLEKKNGVNILKINVEDKLTGIARIGMRINDERYLQPSLDIRNENLFGTGTELGVLFFGGLRNQFFLIEHKANRIFDTYLTYKIKLYYDSKDIYTYMDDPQTEPNKFSRSRSGEYQQVLLGASVGLGMQAGKFGNLIAEFRYEQNDVFNLSNYVITPYKINIAALKFSMQIDTQDKYPYPTSGTKFSTYYETSQKFLGADESYVKYALEYKGYFTINKSHTIIPKFEIGFADETLPLSQQFSFGGQFSFWGYKEYEYRGRQIIIGSLAYRYKLPFKFWFDTYISARYNLGSIWEREEEMKVKNFKHATGVMISWDTPIGPADLGVGRSFIINDITKIIVRGEPTIYFSIGYFF